MEQRSSLAVNDRPDQFSSRAFPEFWCFIDVANDFSTEQPQVVAVQVTGLTGQALCQQVD